MESEQRQAQGQSQETQSQRPVVVVAGASGYIGRALGPLLAKRFDAIGLSRRTKAPGDGYKEWRAVDLFSLRATEQALRGATFAVYLVHSMSPSDRLTQGNFADFDLLCADNFGRAAKRVGAKQIVYLGGILPQDSEGLSKHLTSRLETERALGAHGVPVTTLRAGLVIGEGGSSFAIMERLVKRLPAMVCPAWTGTKAQPIALRDTVQIIDACLGRAELGDQNFDIGGPDIVTYRDMMQQTADALGVRRPMWSIPLLSPKFSRLWLSLVTGAPRALAAPLIESLVHPMLARNLDLQARLELKPMNLTDALQEALSTSTHAGAQPWPSKQPHSGRVRSIQRMALPAGKDAAWAAAEYIRWLPRALSPFLRVTTDDAQGLCRFYVRGFSAPMLVLKNASDISSADRQIFWVTGGMLAQVEPSDHKKPRLEFRCVEDGQTLLTAIHDFAPRLPWPIYVCTQAIAHLLIMKLFARHLRQYNTQTNDSQAAKEAETGANNP